MSQSLKAVEVILIFLLVKNHLQKRLLRMICSGGVQVHVVTPGLRILNLAHDGQIETSALKEEYLSKFNAFSKALLSYFCKDNQRYLFISL